MNQQNNQPIKEIRARGTGISFAVWRNETPREDGTIRTTFSGILKKRYKDKNGQWQNSNSLFAEDWPIVAALMQKATECFVLNESEKANEDIPV